MHHHDHDVVVIGAGQSGLAAAHALQRRGLSYVLLEAGPDVGGSWSRYYDSLTLFSPARFCALPGPAMPGDPRRYPTRDEAAAYLSSYAEHLAAPVRTGAKVVEVAPSVTGWTVSVATGELLRARAVVAATGGFGRPHVPALPGAADYRGELQHVSAYVRPDGYEGKRVVVVGAGNSAIQVAAELARVAYVTLATRTPVRLRSQRPLGVDLHYWLSWSGIDRLPLGRRAATAVGVIDDGRYAAALEAGRPARREMFSRFTDDGVEWPDGQVEPVDAVLLATGYRPQLDYLPATAFGADGWPAHSRGVSTTLPGLGFVGLPGQTGIASATLRGVGADAARVVRSLSRALPGRGTGAAPRPSAAVSAGAADGR